MTDCPDSIAPIVAAWPGRLPVAVKARAVTRLAAPAYELQTGRRATRGRDRTDDGPGGFEKLVAETFDALGIRANAERAVRNYVDLRSALEPRIAIRHRLARRVAGRHASLWPWLEGLDFALTQYVIRVPLAPRETAVSLLARLARADPELEVNLQLVDDALKPLTTVDPASVAPLLRRARRELGLYPGRPAEPLAAAELELAAELLPYRRLANQQRRLVAKYLGPDRSER